MSFSKAVLSEQFREVLRGRTVLAAVFLTFRFDPGFFEQEVLSLLFPSAGSHARPIRLVQLDDALRDGSPEIAVYYDPGGLIDQQGASAKLDVRRIPVRMPNGYFHPKSVIVLVQAVESDEDGARPRTLIVGTMSANLTQAGWWRNVEACHIQEIVEDDKTLLREDLTSFLRHVVTFTSTTGTGTPLSEADLVRVRKLIVRLAIAAARKRIASSSDAPKAAA